MSPEAQRIAIAEACPFVERRGKGERVMRTPDGRWVYFNPLNDLNAMHEAEKVLTDEQFDERYVVELGRLFYSAGKGPWKWSECPTMVVRATAAQRAEAFLKTIGKWEDA